jgi:hypothetical protein
MGNFWKKYGAFAGTILTAAVIAVCVFVYESQYFDRTVHSVLRMVSDAAFVSGIFLAGFGLMNVIAGAGGFDSFAYLLSNMRWVFSPRKASFESRMSYVDYKLKKEKKRKEEEKRPSHMLAVGVVLLALSFLLAIVGLSR